MAEETQDVQVLTIGEKTYFADSVTEHGSKILGDIQKVEQQVGSYTLQMSIANLAKAKLIEELEKEIPKFKEVPQPEETPE